MLPGELSWRISKESGESRKPEKAKARKTGQFIERIQNRFNDLFRVFVLSGFRDFFPRSR
jgi:hypothetical protein